MAKVGVRAHAEMRGPGWAAVNTFHQAGAWTAAHGPPGTTVAPYDLQ
ncbi:hypothetical protein MTDSW087_04993 [Methylobacterium dankookense]|uniref:Uncharacterized protein n=1 Tax=Methylobacterium dankookense TaxID=560405 RepID=A0A564G4M1_9HYPH|nr:hypothetical protein IFDJLNFL_4843 [Methylobacterium dankookense]VUF15257.1 hypothetical protein MTDSW087_04993 [Methylobacterium dankookense]